MITMRRKGLSWLPRLFLIWMSMDFQSLIHRFSKVETTMLHSRNVSRRLGLSPFASHPMTLYPSSFEMAHMVRQNYA